MKKINAIIFCFLTIALLSSCGGSKKLDQSDAENTIKEFVQTNSFGGGGSWGQQGSFDVNSITSIEKIIQFNETEASSVVHFNYQDAFSNGNMNLKFNFKRDIDKKWVLTSVEAISGVGSQGMSDRLLKWQNINLMVVKSNNRVNLTSKIKNQIENAVDPNQVSQNDDESQVKYADIQEFFNAFHKAVQSKDMKEISRFVHFPLQHDEGGISKEDFISGNSYFGNADYFNLDDAFKSASSFQKYGENDYGISGTSLKFSKHKDGYWKLDAAYGSPDFVR